MKSLENNRTVALEKASLLNKAYEYEWANVLGFVDINQVTNDNPSIFLGRTIDVKKGSLRAFL